MGADVADDTSTSARLAGLTNLTRELAQSRTPVETLQAVRRGLGKIYGPITSIILSTQGLSDGEYRVLELHVNDVALTPGIDLWEPSRLPVRRGGPVARIIESPEPRIIRGVDWSGDPVFRDSLAGYDSAMTIPFAGQHLPMTWVILLRRGPDHFTSEDLEQAILRAALIASLLDSQALTEELAKAHALIDNEVRRVGQIQRNLLPDPLPVIPGVKIATSYETFGEAGGDLYDFIELDDAPLTSGSRRWAILIADASGHGPSAAVVIAIVQALLHAQPPSVTTPTALLGHLNEQLCRRPIEGSFVTAFLAVYEPISMRLAYASAGHPPPLLFGAAAGRITQLVSATGLPLGIDASGAFEESSIELAPGDTLLLYTDGIEESRDPNDDMFAVEGIEVAARGCRAGPEQLVASIRQAVIAHAKGRQATDDQTLVAVHFVGDAG